MTATHAPLPPGLEERAVAVLVCEPFPGIATGTALGAGKLTAAPPRRHLADERGRGDLRRRHRTGPLAFDWSRGVTLGRAAQTLHLVTG